MIIYDTKVLKGEDKTIIEGWNRIQHHTVKLRTLNLFPVRCPECGLVNYCIRKSDIQRALTSHMLRHYLADPDIKNELLVTSM